MRLRLESCTHRHVTPYLIVAQTSDTARFRATCGSCYARLVVDYDFTTGGLVARDDTPAVMCVHSTKKPISEAITRRLPYQDALCTTCGRVLRHPDGPGEWREVRFYGFVIHEEPL